MLPENELLSIIDNLPVDELRELLYSVLDESEIAYGGGTASIDPNMVLPEVDIRPA